MAAIADIEDYVSGMRKSMDDNLITISTVRGRQLSLRTSREPFSSSLPKRPENTKMTLNGIRRETNGEITKSRL